MIRKRTILLLNKMVGPSIDGSMNQRKVIHSITGLKRWSCHSRELPRKALALTVFPVIVAVDPYIAINRIKALHVYDFDNTRMRPG